MKIFSTSSPVAQPSRFLHRNPSQRFKSKSKSKGFALVALWVWMATLAAHAATYTWTGAGFFGDQDFLWSNPFNWAGGAAPSAGEAGITLVFPNTGAPRLVTNDIAGFSVATIQFQGAGYEVYGKPSGNALTLDAGSGSFVIFASAANCQFAGTCPLVLGDTNGVIAVASGATFTINSRVNGPGGFTKQSPGTLRLQTTLANTYTGTTTVEDGSLDLNSATLVPSVTPVVSVPGALMVGGTNLNNAPLVRLLRDDQIADFSPVRVNENGRLWLNGHDDDLGALTLNKGARVNTGVGSTPNSPGLLTLNGDVTILNSGPGFEAIIAGRLSLGALSRTINVASRLTITAAISGSPILNPGFNKTGPGWLQLSGATNTYTGFTYVLEGTLGLSGPTPLLGATSAGTAIAAGALLSLQDVNIGAEALTLTGVANDDVLRFNGTNTWAGPVTLEGDCALYNFETDDRLTFSGVISGDGFLRKTGKGVMRFTGNGANTFTGGLFAERGFVDLDKLASVPALSGPLVIGRAGEMNQSTSVRVKQNNQIPDSVPVTLLDLGSLSTEGTATDTLGPIEIAGGTLSGLGGPFTLSGNVTNRLSTNNTGAIYGQVILSAGEHVFHCDELSRLEVHGVLQGSGAVTKSGAISTLAFYNTNSYSGLTHVKEGDLWLEGQGRPGSSAAGTVVDGFAILQLHRVSVTNETLTLEPLSSYAPIIFSLGTNRWQGPVVLNAPGDFRALNTTELTIDGPISGSGGLSFVSDFEYSNDSKWILAGSQANTYSGDTTIKAGTLALNKLNATAIPGNLVIGFPTNGAPAASVVCQQGSQFEQVTVATLPSRLVTIHPSGALYCGGFEQFIANLSMLGGAVFTENGEVSLHRDWTVLANSGGGGSSFFGQLRLASPFNNNTHLLDIQTNASLQFWGDINQGIFVANLRKLGGGELAMISSNSFDGTFTVSNGRVLAAGTAPFGTANGGTIVQAGATVMTFGGINAEPFTLSGHGYTNQGALVASGTNTFDGSIWLAADANVVTPINANLAIFTGVIAGPGGMTKTGPGTLRFAGAADNSFNGTTRVQQGVLELTKTNTTAIRGALEVAVGSGDGFVRYLRSDQLSDLTPVTVGANGQLRLLGHSDTVGSLAGFGIVELLGGTLTTGNDSTSTTYGGVISGLGGGVTKIGPGTFTLTGNNAYTGVTTVKAGTLLVRGQQPQSAVQILTGGTLAGDGAVGSVSDLSGHVKPGAVTYGILKCGNFSTFAPANLLELKINGTNPGVNCDQLDVAGSVLLMGGTLQVAMNFPGGVSNQYVIVKNDGADPVSGSFTGLPEGTKFYADPTHRFEITYMGGDGNDVVLKTVASPGQLKGITTDGHRATISGCGIPGATYHVQATTTVADPASWADIGTVIAGPDGLMQYVDADMSLYPHRFYRFVVP
jgi:autotransporter-associated beta strand protein